MRSQYTRQLNRAICMQALHSHGAYNTGTLQRVSNQHRVHWDGCVPCPNAQPCLGSQPCFCAHPTRRCVQVFGSLRARRTATDMGIMRCSVRPTRVISQQCCFIEHHAWTSLVQGHVYTTRTSVVLNTPTGKRPPCCGSHEYLCIGFHKQSYVCFGTLALQG